MALPPFPELAIGPYRHCFAMFVASVERNAANLNTKKKYSNSASQGYLLQAIGELIWSARIFELPERERLIAIALSEIAELRGAASLTTGAAPGFGKDKIWDAFNDGSKNPAFTAYAFQSGMVALGVAKIARVLVSLQHFEATSVREFGVALVEKWHAHYTVVKLKGKKELGGYFWYSTEKRDAVAVHNTNALLAMASQILAESGATASLLERPRAVVNLLWARMNGNPEQGYEWHYADDGLPTGKKPTFEDVSHAAITLQLMRFAADRGWWPRNRMRGVAATLVKRMWAGNPAHLQGLVNGSMPPSSPKNNWNVWKWTQGASIGFATHGDAVGGDPKVFDLARSILFSSYLSRNSISLNGGTVDPGGTLALALLLTRRPAPFEKGSRWETEAGSPGDNGAPFVGGGARFYSKDWHDPRPFAAGLTLMARIAAKPNANLLIDLESGFKGRVIVSLTYHSTNATEISEWDGKNGKYVTIAKLPVTKVATTSGTKEAITGWAHTWFRTTFELDPSIRYDYQSGQGTNVLLQIGAKGVAVHRIEATPL
jgi:hypothetical protein